MADKSIKSINLLPEFFRTEKNSKFLSSTIDQLIQPPKLERVDGYIGSKLTPTYNSTANVYISETSALRRNYQLEPALIVKDSLGKINDVIGLDDLTNEITNKGGNVSDFDRLYRSKLYAYDPHIDWDKFVNYQEYYWLTNGPDSITITGAQLNSTSTFAVRDNVEGTSFIFRPDGLTEDPLITLYRGNTYTFDVNSEYNFYIKTFPSVGDQDQYNLGVSNNGTNNGRVTIIVDSSTPSTLFYTSDDQQNTVGRFNVKTIDQDSRISVDEEIVGKKDYTSGTGIKLSNGMKIRFGGTVIPSSYENREFYVEGVGSAIKLIDADTLTSAEAMSEIYNENFDGSDFDSFPFDNFKNLPLVPEYITINRASGDLNPWSRYNRWVHKDVIATSARVNGLEEPVYPENKRARRPIIEFKADLKLWNFGAYGIPDVDFIDTKTTDAFSLVEGSAGHHVDEHLLQQGNRVIFAADEDDLVRNKIYEVNYIVLGGKLRLELVEIKEAIEQSSVTIINGKEFKGTNWWFDGSNWIFGQQHDRLNQAPLFELFDSAGISYNSSKYNSNFAGNKIFGYEIGTGAADPILGFPLRYKNSSGIGSFTFRNYFSTESFTIPVTNNQVETISTDVTYCRFSHQEGNTFKNVWTETEEYPIPILTVDGRDFYAPPVGLTNNPLNGPIDRLTLSEISDHVRSMIDRAQGFDGDFPGTSNIRDLDNISKYGTRLVSNLNPISFAQMFIGKKEHNVLNALSRAADQYNQFKLAFLKKIQSINPELTPIDAVDTALKELNIDKDILSSWYNSDMVPYGSDYTERTWTITNLTQTIFPIASDFTLNTLSKRSVLVYLNGAQLLNGYDYKFVENDSSVEIIKELSIGDFVAIKDYPDTSGSFIPSTPSKFTDYTYIEPAEVIQGHDGSLTKSYGDYRDDIILELETRIFNNIKVGYKQELLDVNSALPGAFRTETFNLSEINNIISKDFIKWSGFYGIDPYDNSAFDADNTLTWNYSKSYIETLGKNLNGSWRFVFKYLYDTDRPHTHPWEMLGFSEMPDWWEDEYGPSPYTSGNDILWQDIEQGLIRRGNRQGTHSLYARLGLSNLLPVDDGGNLVDPNSLVTNITGYNRRQNWVFGDMGPAETAWRRSSYWPFVVQKLLAITQPASYSAFMYDPSRLEKNIANQWTYGDDHKFLTFKNLYIHDDDTLTNGYSVLVSEIGNQKSKKYTSQLKQDLDFADFNLFYKVGGFVSKDKLQIIIDAIDPVSSSPGAILPPEDYTLILNVSNPVKSTSISGIIVQKGKGKYVLKGYDTGNPYFNVLTPMRTVNTPTITVGGVSENFVTWQASSSSSNSGINQSEFITAKSSSAGVFYTVGQIVEYQNQYYRVKTAHRSGDSFDSQYFQSMPYLPIKGGAIVQLANKFDNTVRQIPYGAEFEKIQDVYDVIVGYGAWLEKQGFVFDDFNKDLNSVLNWEFTGKEFLYWTTQNWADNSVITLSPFADKVKFKLPNSVVDNIFDSFYDYSILQANGIALPRQNLSVNREDGLCTISVTGSTEGIYFATLNNVQKEHAIVFNNQTMFNDTIYDIETGYRQRRMKLVGFRTKDWDGDYFSPGFVYDVAAIADWKTFTDYRYGDVVKFAGKYYSALNNVNGSEKFNFNEWTLLGEQPVAGLLPNFDYKIGQFEDFYSLDIDNFDAAQQKMAQRLIGYTPRVYLNNIFTNPIAQYKFYQGFIREKGTKNSVSKLAKASIHNLQGELDFTEEWAFRVGHFGSYETFKEIEIPLREGKFIENPQVVSFVDQVPTQSNDLIYYSTSSDRLIKPADYISSLTFVTTSSLEIIKLDTAGFVRLDDVQLTAYDVNTILDIADVRSFDDGDTIWLANKENGDWDVLRYTLDPARVIKSFMDPANVGTMTFVTNGIHNLEVGDLISISQFDDNLNGVYRVTRIPKLNRFEVGFESDVFVSGAEPEVSGLLFKFLSVKFNSFNELFDDSKLVRLPNETKVWINDDGQGKWVVYQKINNYNNLTISSTPTPDDQKLGWKITKKKNNDIFLVGAPGYVDTYNTGTAFVYSEKTGAVQFKLRYGFNSDAIEYHASTNSPDFGSALAYDDRNFNQTGFGLMIVGAPSVSYVKSISLPNKVNYSTGTESPSLLTYQGAVKFSSIDPILIEENTERVLVSPNPVSDEKFGFSLFIEDNQRLGINTALAERYATDVLNMIVNPGTEDYSYDINGDGVIDLNDSLAYLTLSNGANLSFTPNINSNYTSLIWSGKQLFVGAPGTSTSGTGSVYKYRVFTTSTNSPVDLQYVGKITTSTITTVSTGSRWGHAISGSVDASVVAISAPGYNKNTGFVSVFTGTMTTFTQTINSPFGNKVKFGEEIKVSPTGDYLFVSAPDARSTDQAYGKVAVYKNQSGQFTYLQTINNPRPRVGMKFGQAIDVNEDASELVISAVGLNRNVPVTFDVYSELLVGAAEYVNDPYSDETDLSTTFDSQSTRFFDNIIYSGSSYVYNRKTDLFRLAGELRPIDTNTGTNFGYSVAMNENSIYVGAPAYKNRTLPDEARSAFFQFYKDDITQDSWKILREQDDLVDVDTIQKIALVDSFNEEVVEYLDVIDPLKGKIAGIAEQDLTYKSSIDPAVYTIGNSLTVVDPDTSWLDEHVGELWWDLSSAKFVMYEQGDLAYRKNNWGQLFPGASIDVYEWVGSELLPSEWAELADTPEGLTRNISGQPKHLDNTVVSVKQVYNYITNSFVNEYYFWVKNKVIVPNSKNRRISARQVASLIENPTQYGLRYAAVIDSNAIALANVGNSLVGDRINVNVSMDVIKNQIPKHTEWLLLQENSPNSVPNTLLEKKLIDSLLGHDSLGNLVPDPSLSFRQRYGIGVRPRQTMFKDRFDALRNLIEFTNGVLIKNRITGNFSFKNLNKQELIPHIEDGEYDLIVEDNEGLEIIDTRAFVTAQITCAVDNGKIRSVQIIEPGLGYRQAPSVTIKNNKGADIRLKIDEFGRVIDSEILSSGSGFTVSPELEVRPFSVIVLIDSESNKKWSKFIYDKNTSSWVRVQTQKYNTTLYWNYVDWVSDTYNKYVDLAYTIDEIYQLDTLEDVSAGQYIKIKNGGLGKFIILEKTKDDIVGNFNKDYNIVFSENGTIQIKDEIWNFNNLGFDKVLGLDQTLYDQTPDLELENILIALKKDIFINELKVNWNLFFFTAVKYALSEQKLLDWAFKTSFINVTNNAGSLDQRPVYKLQNSGFYEDYLKEVKPYHTKIRRFTTNYSVLENNPTQVTDFDLPAYYNTETNKFEVIEISASTPSSQFTLTEKLTTVYPYKSWADNYSFGIGSISISNPGQGYATEPTVTILPAIGDSGSGASAKAYIRSGEIFEIEVTNPGSGYLIPPTVYISGGGPSVVTTASAYANLYNSKVRSVKLGLKFDRTTRSTQIPEVNTVDRFVCDGSEYQFRLNWLAVPDKAKFTVKLDGSIVLGSDYTIVYDDEYSSDLQEYTDKFCKLVFLNFVPKANQLVEVSYLKNINLLNAVDRINNYYRPRSGMPGTDTSQLISGIIYPKTKIEALKFDYTTKWDLDYSMYGETAWADDIGYYVSTTATNTATSIGSTWTSIKLASVNGITPGQFANVISTTTNAFTTSSVRVVSVNSATKIVVLNAFTSTILTPGTEIEFWNYSSDLTVLDSAIDGGTWNTSTRISALGINPEDISIIGDGFITPNTSYAPDELIPGEVNESLGISVFTKNPEGAPVVVASYFNVLAGTTTTQRLSIVPPNYASIRVKFNDTILAYNSTTNFISDNEFAIDWETNEIVVPPQSVNGKVAYTIISVGGGRESVEAGVIDTASITSDDGGSVQVVSLAEYGTVKSAYVTVDGVSTTDFVLGPANAGNNRAAVVVNNLTTGTTSTITAWFFGTANKYFNEIVEQIENITISTNFIPLKAPPGIIEPMSAQIIVEYTDSMGTRYLRPPHVDYYQVTNTLTKVYTINNDGYYLAPSSVRTFINGNELRKGFDFRVIDVAGIYKVSIFVDISLNDVIAIVALPQNSPHVDYDYDVVNNTLVLTNSVSTGTFKIITFTNHDDMLTRTERFNGTPNRRYKLSRPVLDENYVWVVVNGVPLINKHDYEILDDMVTVQVSDQFEHDWNYSSQTGDDVVITSISSAKLAQNILGYRIFNDIFDRTHYKRLSKENTTYLTKPLYFTDTEIHVADASVLRPPIVAKNLPGVILVDGERIEFFQINGNVLTQLRRSTLGTAPALFCEEMTKVMDQSVEQTVPFTDQIKRQDQLTISGQDSYAIQPIEHIYNTGTYQQFVNDGIVLSASVPAADQIKVFYGGRPLRKVGQFEHDITVTWDNQQADLSTVEFISNINNVPETEVIGKSYVETATNKVWVYEDSAAESAINGYVYKGLRWAPPEFTVTTSTQQITLNIENGVQDGVLLTVVKKEFARTQVWNTEITTATTKSLMDSETVPAKFLQARPAELPDKYYYGGDPALTEDSGFAITDQNDKPLQGY